MIDSEVSDKLKYRYDPETEETHLDIENVDNVDIAGYMTATGMSLDSMFAGTVTNTNQLIVRSPSNQNAFNFDVGTGREWMKGRQIANNQLYYHCVKLTSATKTVYVNIPTRTPAPITSKLLFVNAIKGSLTNLNGINWYYGTDAHVVHAFYESTGSSKGTVKVMLDDEEVTGYEGHVNGLYINKHEVVE